MKAVEERQQELQELDEQENLFLRLAELRQRAVDQHQSYLRNPAPVQRDAWPEPGEDK